MTDVSQFPVVILCGGKGTRFREQTEYRPKPMIEVGDRPIVWHIMDTYAAYGFRKFVLCLGYKAEVIKNYFLNFKALNSSFSVKVGSKSDGTLTYHDGHVPDWDVTLVDTGLESMTGARIAKIRPYINSDHFLLTYGDGLCSVDIADTVKFHLAHGKHATVTGVHPPSRFGLLSLEGNRVSRFSEKTNVDDGYINGGFFVLSKRVFEYVSEEPSCIFEKTPLERLATDGQLHVYKHEGFWQCMDNARDLERLEQELESGKPAWRRA